MKANLSTWAILFFLIISLNLRTLAQSNDPAQILKASERPPITRLSPGDQKVAPTNAETLGKLEKAADGRDVNALFELWRRADAYEKGEGVPQDLEKAETLYWKISESKMETSAWMHGFWPLINLASKYRDGDGITRNGSKAVQIFERRHGLTPWVTL